MLRKLFKLFMYLIGVLVILIIGVAVFFDLDEELNAQKDAYLPEVEKLLGRKVQVGTIKTTLWPDLGAEISDIQISGRPGDEAPLVKIARIQLEADWWNALISFGSDVQLKALVVDGLEATLIQEADGTLSYDDIIARLSEGPPKEEEAPAPMDPETVKTIQEARLDRIAIQNSKITLIDRTAGDAPVTASVSDLLLELTDVQLKDAFEVKLQAAVLTEQRNFDLRVKLGPVPIGTDADLPVEWITLKADGVDLAALAPYLGKGAPIRLEKASFSADLKIEDPAALSGPIKAHGTLDVAPFALPGGQPFNLHIAPNLEMSPKGGTLDINGLKIALDDMAIEGSGSVSGLRLMRPQFSDLKLATQNMHLGRLKALLGPLMPDLGPGAKLDGPLILNVTANGDTERQQIALALDLDQAIIILPGAFNKPAKTALHLQLKAGLAPNDLDLKQFDLTAGGVSLDLKGTIKQFKDPIVDITGGTGRFNITGPARLSPAVAKAIPPDVQLAGQGEIDVKLKRSGKNLDARINVGVFNADLDVPGATLKGSGQIDLSAKGAAEAMSIEVDGDLSGLALALGDALRKQAGAPMTVKVSARQQGKQINISRGDLRFGPLKLSATGSVPSGEGSMNVKAKLERFTVAQVAQMVPSLKGSPFASATLGLDAALQGNLSQPATVQAEISNFYFAQKGSSLSGQLSVANLDAPKIRFDFTSPNLDLDALLPASEGEAEEETPAGAPDPMLKKIDAQGGLKVAKGVAGGFPFKDLQASLTLKGGVLTFTTLKFDAYDGQFVLTPTSARIADAVPSFKTHVAMKRVDVQKLLTEQASLPGTLSGRITTEVDIEGKGADWQTLSKTLSGSLGVDLSEGVLKTLDLEQAVYSPLNEKFGKLFPMPKGRDGTRLGKVNTRFNVKQGKMMLAELLKLDTQEGPLQLNGAIGLDKSLDLKGTLMVSPARLNAVSGGKLKLDKAIPVSLSIGGTVTKPKISGLDAAVLVAALAPQIAKSLGAEKALEAAQKAEALAREKAEEAKQKAKEIADKAKQKANEAKAKARAEAEKAKAEAERRAKAAADKAKKKAEDKAKKALKGLF